MLVVEDNPDTRVIYEETLRTAGYEVETAASLAEAERAAEFRKPDVAILDCRLPDGCGIDLLKRWKESPSMAEIPVVMATAHSASEFIRAASTAGADAFLVKPCWDDLTAFVGRIVQGARNARAGEMLQTTAQRRRYRTSTHPPSAITRAAPALFDAVDGRLLARCHRCFRSSPTLGHTFEEANDSALRLGWAMCQNRWTCPVCLERYKLSE